MTKHPVSRAVLVALMLVALTIGVTVAYAESAQNLIVANYTIPDKISASDETAFYGIWKAQYANVFGTVYEIAPMDLAWTFEIFDNGAMIYNNNAPFYLTGRSFKNGCLSFADASGTIELTLRSNGDISFVSDGFDVFCEKREVDYKTVDYLSLARRPETYNGTYAVFTGSVVQVIGSRTGDYYQIRLALDDMYEQIILAEFIKRPDYNILENDTVTVFVRLAGEYTYETIWGSTITVPLAFIHSIELTE